ncbi:MAG: BspA family leucine-rich repeat surface protein [Lachnospiraceae bacterium]|nr:BspA family leucine-rich repeat surface protein [Lachnospiraceae bacterium]
MGKWRKWKRLLAGAAAVIVLSVQLPVDSLAMQSAGNDLCLQTAENGLAAQESVSGEGLDWNIEESALSENNIEDKTVAGEKASTQIEESVQTGYVNGTDNAVSWTYDPETKTTTVTGEGTRNNITWSEESAFPKETEYIRFENCKMQGSLYCLFYGLTNLLSIDFAGLQMENITNMRAMFYGCSGLRSLDLGSFDTSKVTNMEYMFYGCSGLTSLDIGNFDTSRVTDMEYMFYGCSGLRSLDIGSFDTSRVTDMGYMFYYCGGLRSLDVGSFDTSQVTDMGYMFYYCGGLRSLDIGSFDTSQVTDMSGMFSYCGGLTSLDIGSFDTSQVTCMEFMFSYCSGLTSLDLGNFDTSRVMNMGYMFLHCSGLRSLDIGNFDTSRVTSMWSMFSSCSGLRSLDIGSFDTSRVTDMGYMFSGCSGLRSLDIGSFDTSRVTDMRSMFYGCSGLTSLDLGSFDTSQVTDMGYMFSGCSSLDILSTPKKMGSVIVALPAIYTDAAGNQTTELTASFAGTTLTKVDDTQGLLSGYVDGTDNMVSWIYDPETKTATVTGEGKRTAAGSESAFPKETEYIRFENCTIEGLYDRLFYKLENLISIDFTGLEMKNATSMWGMFYGCSSITSLDLGSFDTSQVMSMGVMFRDCSSLTSVDLEGIDTSHVTDMGAMFYGCSNLTRLNLKGIDTSHVLSMGNMFRGCSSLEHLDLGDLNTSQVTDMWYMFEGCSSLESLDLGGLDTSQVTTIYGMFYGCSGLTSLNLEGMDTSQVTEMVCMFKGCSGLTSLDLKGMDTSQVTSMRSMFSGCSSLTSLDLSNFNTDQMTDMYGMFSDCSSLTSLELENIDTSQVRSMEEMFSGCSSLENLNLSNFTIKNGTETNSMLDGCINLSTIIAPSGHMGNSIALPSAIDYIWRLPDGTEVTEVPKGLETAVEITRREAASKEPEIIHVSTTEELLSAIGSSRSIILADGIYEINTRLTLSGLEDLVIQAENPGRAEILSHDGSESVVFVKDCTNIKISGCIMGHEVLVSAGCSEGGNVINVYTSQEIKISDCDLYGCGVIGILGHNSQDICVENSVIRDCKNSMAYFYASKGNVVFKNCVMSGNNYSDNRKNAAILSYANNLQWNLENCVFLNNRYSEFTNITDENMTISYSIFQDNIWDNQEPGEYGICLNGLTWQIEGDILKLGYPLRFADSTVIESAQVEPLPYSDASLPWKKYSYRAVDKAWEEQAVLPAAVKFVPYEIALTNGGNQGVTAQRAEWPEELEGFTLSDDGKVNGVPKVSGNFTFTVFITDSEGAERACKYILEVTENTEENYDTYADPGYELVKLVPDIYLEDLPEDGEQLMVSQGAFEEFVALYLDGELLTPGEDYVAASGSTRITIMNQTLKRNGVGMHTLAMEFRIAGTNDLRWAAQNFIIADEKDDEGNEDSGNQDGSNGNEGGGNEDENQGGNNGDENQGNTIQGEEVSDRVITYTVKKGDTLWKVAGQLFGSGRYWRRIYEENKTVISNPNRLRIGQILTITLYQTDVSAAQSAGSEPGKSGTMGGKTTYIVEAGDNLYKIASKLYGHGRYWEEIYKANQDRIAEPEKIYAKQVLAIP